VLRTIVDDVPSLVLVLLTVVITVSIVFGGVWLVRRYVPATREGFDAEVSSQVLGVVAALFGLFLAFVIVIEFQNFDGAQSNVDQEADSLAAITRDSRVFPAAEGDRVRRAVGAYVREVVNDEWPQMHRGGESNSALDAVDGMYAAFQSVRPRSPEAIAFYDDGVKQLNQALIARRDRIGDAGGGLSSLVLALIAIGSCVILGYAMLVGSRSYWFHAIGACAIALVVALSLVVLVDLSYPFSGDLSISSDPFKSGALAQFFPR
jgi:hypothetical protein